MGRSARLAVGVVAAALAAEHVGANYAGAAVALAMAFLLVLGTLSPDSRCRGAGRSSSGPASSLPGLH